MRRRLRWPLAAAVVVLAALSLWRVGPGPVSSPLPAADDAGTQTSLPALANPGGARATTALPAQLRAPSSSASASRWQFDRADDLYALARAITPAVAEGEPEAVWTMSRIVDTCAAYAADPDGYARDSAQLAGMRLPAAATVQAARERLQARCRRFVPADGLSGQAALRLRRQAARAGHLVAEAELLGMGQPLEPGEDYAQDLVARVRDSADAEAFRGLSPAMTGRTGVALFAVHDIAPQYGALVWQLAACRLGLDCGPDSALMTAYCIHGGICSRDPRQGFEEFVYDAAVPRQSADLVRRMVEALVRGNGGDT
jgi:hypothetical protein